TFFEKVGDGSRVLLLTEGEKLVAFSTYAKMDEIQPTVLFPWLGFVYTFPEYRGHRYAGLLFKEAERLAREEGKSALYVSTDHIGLYEKYGFAFREEAQSIYSESARVYEKKF
ncbi:MAG: GNAT family N-acetyltransferase, partial [Treponema sp.]|nr:GNAT family N-acetyltransferase [Treponema sp.]